jgi:TolB-like protein/Flp pilus assembly protein TadD
MHLTESSAGPVRNQLDKILSSRGFAGNDRLSKFLRFVVERHLEGKGAGLKESLVGIEVFCRRPGFDPRKDSVVRTEAARLRVRLSQYYAADGAADPLVIELPKGGYTPVFREAKEARENPAPTPEVTSSRPGRRLWLAVALAGVVIVLGAGGWWWALHQSAPIPIAVLPLDSLSQDPGNDYFADGLTDEIIRNLSIVDGLAVRSQTSSFVFKGRPRNVREAGKQLQADYILEGSVLRASRRLRINVQLIRVRDDLPLWSGKFDRESTDIFAIQEEISRGIVNSLRLRLGGGRRRYETSPEAYDLYLRARAAFLGSDQAVGAFEETINKDPAFAPAYAGLATAHAHRSGSFRLSPADEVAKARVAAERAIQLDPLLGEAYVALGAVHSRDAHWEQSETDFRRAIELDPSSSESYNQFAMFLLLPLGRIEEALHQFRVAERVDPLSSRIQNNLAYVLISAGRYDEAAGHCQKLPADYRLKSQCLGRARLGQGRIGEAIQVLETDLYRGVPAGSDVRGFLGNAYARAGRREEAENLAAASPPDPFDQAVIYAGLGDKDRTLEALNRGTTAGPFRIGRALTFPELALLRGDPRVKALRKKVGLPE